MGLGVMLGAFGAHALKERLDAYSLGVYEKAVFYHFVHAPRNSHCRRDVPRWRNYTVHMHYRMRTASSWSRLIFRQPLFACAHRIPRAWRGHAIGGLAFIGAWLLLAYRLLRASV